MYTGEYVQRIPKGFRCRFFSEDSAMARDIIITDDIIDKFDTIKPGEKIKMPGISGTTGLDDTIIFSKKIQNKKEYLILELEEMFYKILRAKLIRKRPKSMYFLVSVDVRHFNSIHLIEDAYTKYIKIFDTKNKAYHFTSYFIDRFVSLYQKYLLSNKIECNILSEITSTPGLIYDHSFTFRNKKTKGITCYNFNITCVEKG